MHLVFFDVFRNTGLTVAPKSMRDKDSIFQVCDSQECKREGKKKAVAALLMHVLRAQTTRRATRRNSRSPCRTVQFSLALRLVSSRLLAADAGYLTTSTPSRGSATYLCEVL